MDTSEPYTTTTTTTTTTTAASSSSSPAAAGDDDDSYVDDEVITEELLRDDDDADNANVAFNNDLADSDASCQDPASQKRLRELQTQRKKMLTSIRDEQNRKIQEDTV
jgi:hypothetical protein